MSRTDSEARKTRQTPQQQQPAAAAEENETKVDCEPTRHDRARRKTIWER